MKVQIIQKSFNRQKMHIDKKFNSLTKFFTALAAIILAVTLTACGGGGGGGDGGFTSFDTGSSGSGGTSGGKKSSTMA